MLRTLTRAELAALLVETYGKAATREQTVAEQRKEIARLKGLEGRPNIEPNVQPSGLEKGTAPTKPAKGGKRPTRGKVTPRVKIEDELIAVAVPPGSTFKGMSLVWSRIW
jgi:hypothetical protein